MPRFKLTYFDFSGSRGEECRLALHLAGVEFEDQRIKAGTFASLRAETPYGALPVLEIEGVGKLGQSNAILGYIGRTHGLHPSEPFAAAQHEAVMNAVEDLRVRLQPLARIKDADEKKRAREEAAGGYLQEWGAHVEHHIATGPFFGGEQIQVADLKIYVATDSLIQGVVDHIPATVFAAFPKLTALHAAVKKHPKVVEWQSRKH